MNYDGTNNSNSSDLIFADLQDIANEFDAVEPSEDSGSYDLPEGKYTTRIDRLYLDKYSPTERPILKWSLEVVDGELAGRKQSKANFLKTESNIAMLKADLAKAGLDMKAREISFIDLPGYLEELIDVLIDITVKKSGGEKKKQDGSCYFNVFVNSRVSEQIDVGNVAAPAPPTATHPVDRIAAAPRTSTSATRAREQF